MLKNYFKIALRNLVRYKTFSMINILGLAVGMACTILILLWVGDELSYDRFHEKSDRIYRLCSRIAMGNTIIDQTQTPTLLPVILKNDYPEVEQTVRIGFPINVLGQYKEKSFMEHNMLPVDSTFFDVFSFKLIKGNKNTALTEPGTIVITEATAHRYFGDEDPIGKMILLQERFEVRVTGVVENIPRNSHFHFDILLSLATIKEYLNLSWESNDFRTYIVLREGYPSEQLEAKFPNLITKYVGKGNSNWLNEGNKWDYYLQSLTDIHLKSDIISEFETNGNIVYVYIFTIIAFVILFIACVNFMNLTTAKFAHRTKEIGLRKVVGSTKGQIIFQFLSESLFLCLIAFCLSILFVYSIMPVFNSIVGKHLTFHLFDNYYTSLILLGLAILVGLLAGIYPSFYLSSFKPVMIFRGKIIEGMKSLRIRNALVVFQFSITVALLIGTFIVGSQVEYFQSKKLGFEKENLIVIKNVQSLGEQNRAFKDAMLKYSTIKNISGSYSLPGGHFVSYGFIPENSESVLLNFGICDPEYLETLNLELSDGRFFSRDFSTDSTAIIINETAVKLLNWDKPIGKTLTSLGRTFNVIGIVKDFHYESLHQKVKPMALLNLNLNIPWQENYITVRTNIGNVSETIKLIENEWKSFTNNKPFDYSFLDQDYGKLYINEKQTGKVFWIFSSLAILIACLGLYGLVSFTIEKRTKEIGIRKVLGAHIPSILMLFTKELSKWVLISNIIAWPIAWLIMNRWLQDFAYRINITFWPFLLSGLIALLIAIATVSYQSIKAAVANPVISLRSE